MRQIYQKLYRLLHQSLMKIVATAIFLSLLLIAWGSWNIWQISHNFQDEITDAFKLQHLSGEITYLDEVLTMSARMAAATGDLDWETRYRQHEPILDKTIKQAIELAPDIYERYAVQTDTANVELVAMENQAFALIRQGKPEAALALLFSPEYALQKKIYAEGNNQIITALNKRVYASLATYGTALSHASFFSVVSFIVLTAAWLTILGLVGQYIRQRQQAEQHLQLAKQELERSNHHLAQSQIELTQKANALEQALQDLQASHIQLIQSEKMSSLGQLVAGVAHEINNPINFIYGNVGYLQDYAHDLLALVKLYQDCYPEPVPEIKHKIDEIDLAFLQEDLVKILTSISVGTDRIRQIVLSLRNFCRTDESEFKSVDIHEGIDSTLMLLQHRLKKRPGQPEIEVIRDYANLPLVDCYPGQLNQVIMNILANAIDALEVANERMSSEDQNRHSQITIRTAIVDNHWVKIAIADNGPGIPESVKEQIFNPFFTTKEVGKGTGMGLSISYQIIVEKHGGRLTCASTLDQGTEFVIEIPIHQHR